MKTLGWIWIGLVTAGLGAGAGSAQVIPRWRTFGEAWQHAGYPGEVPAPPVVASVTDFGAAGDGIADDTAAIEAALAAAAGQGGGAVRFPAGIYRVTRTLHVPAQTVLRGDGADATLLVFDAPVTGHGIEVSGPQHEPYQPAISGYGLHSDRVEVADAAVFQAGDYAEIRQDNTPGLSASDWAPQVVGQIVRIAAVDGATVMLERPLRMWYRADLNPVIRRVTPVTEVGIECLALTRVLNGSPTSRDNQYSIRFDGAARCWVRGVESRLAFGAHVAIQHSTNIEVTGCYLHDAYEFDGGGSGYGVKIGFQSGECLIQDNIFAVLRHAMLVQGGANGNVFGYNYSTDPVRVAWPPEATAEIACHGNFPYANLFEGNICGNIELDWSHGANGFLNTFFRNRAEGYGIRILSLQTHLQTFVGNETGNGCWAGLVGHGYLLLGIGHFTFGNNTQQFGLQPPCSGWLRDTTYYLSEDPTAPPPRPSFWTLDQPLPTIGPPHPLVPPKQNPARARYLAGGPFTVPSSP